MKRLIFLLFLLQVTLASAQTTGRISPITRWGVDLTTRLDTLSPLFCDTLRMNGHTFRIVTDTNYNIQYFPRIYNGMLVFADQLGNVQNMVVTEYEYTFFTGPVDKTSRSRNRELWPACMTILNHKNGDSVTVKRVVCQDLTGQKMLVRIPPFTLVKIR